MKIRTLGPVGHCSAKLRAALAVEEERALLWRVSIRHTRDQDEKGSSGGRFKIAPSFDVPGPFASRPLSPEGRVSFHFSEQTVTKFANGGSLITSAKGQKRLPANAASKHDAYVARPDAVLTVSSADFVSYAERPSAVELEAEQAAIFSNISDDPDERYRFWKAVHQHERTGKPDRLVFHQDRLSIAGWRRLSEATELTADVRSAVEKMLATPMAKPSKKGNATLEMGASEGRRLCGLMKQICASEWDRKAPPVRVAVGRNGRTQFRLTAEFPVGLDAAARVRITKKFCGKFGDLGCMYTAAIHEPDEHNDERNHHLHLAYYDRPCAIVPGTGKWDFEIREKVIGQHNRYTYPFRQPKIAELGRDPDGGGYAEYRASIIYRGRQCFSELCNDELQLAGLGRHFDPRRYSEMGIDQPPTEPLGTKAAPLEAVGVPTPAGCRNAETLWTARLTKAVETDKKRRAERAQVLAKAAGLVSRSEATAQSGGQERLLRNVRELTDLNALLNEHELEIEEFGVMLEMAYARPQKAFDTCSQILAALNEGKGTRSDRSNHVLIARRKATAEDFLSAIDAIQEECMVRIEPILVAVKQARKRVRELSLEVERLSLDTSPNQPAAEAAPSIPMTEAQGGSENQHSAINALIDHIAEQDLHVLEPSDEASFYRVPGISRDEFQLLSSSRTFAWVQDRLAAIAGTQKMRMGAAAHALNRLGRETLEQRAAQSSDLRRALKWIDAYATHPTFLALIRPAPAKPTLPSKPEVDTVVIADQMKALPDPTTAPSEPSRNKYVLPTNHGQDIRADAIRAYVAAVLQEPDIRFMIVDGEPRVDPSSVPSWALSAASFAEEPLIKQAIIERRAASLDRDRARDRQKIILELKQATRRPIERFGDRWVVNHISERYRKAANDWQDHPVLVEAYQKLDELWTARELRGSTIAQFERDLSQDVSLEPNTQQEQRHEIGDILVQASYLADRAGRAR